VRLQHDEVPACNPGGSMVKGGQALRRFCRQTAEGANFA